MTFEPPILNRDTLTAPNEAPVVSERLDNADNENTDSKDSQIDTTPMQK